VRSDDTFTSRNNTRPKVASKRLALPHGLIPADAPTKPFSIVDETDLKPRCGPINRDQQRGTIMWDIIISLFYHHSCRSSLVEMRTHHLAG
jgi:hypothetical protein